jgi:Flp pilus assembly protein TadD
VTRLTIVVDNRLLVASTALDREAVDEAVSRGSDLLKQGKLDDAIKAFRAAMMIDNENPRVLALLGLTHFRAGQFTQARPIYEELVERAPTDASHRLNLGLVYLKLGESDKAIGALESSRALDPSQGRAVSYLGLAYARAGRYAEAYRSFLLAGQNDLATEIETNLTAAEREGIHAQLGALPRAEPKKTPPPPPMSQSRAEIPLSMPAIVIDRPPVQEHVEPPPPSMPEIIVDRPELAESRDDQAAAPVIAPEATDSQQFVLPERQAVPAPAAGQSMISRAVEVASPNKSATAGATKISAGSTAPIPLSQLATDQLVRPEDGAEPFEVTASGALVIRVADRVLSRLEGVHVTGGELEFEPATRRSRGSQTDENFDYGGSRMHVVSGAGYLIAAPRDRQFTAVVLDDDIFYLREDLVFAFEASLRWENGNVPGLRGKLPVVQFRGDGAVALRTAKPLVRVKLPAQGVVYVDSVRLAGWIGRVVPRAVVPPSDGPMGEVCVECTGEGVVLVDPSDALPAPPVATSAGARPHTASKGPPPPPQPAGHASSPESTAAAEPSAPMEGSGLIELDVVKKADWLADDDAAEKSAPTDGSVGASSDGTRDEI